MPRQSSIGVGRDESVSRGIRHPRDLWQDWDRYVARHEATASESLRAVMRWIVRADQPVQDALNSLVAFLLEQQSKKTKQLALPIPKIKTGKVERGAKKRIELGLTASELAAVKDIAEQSECSPQFWIVSLIRAALTRGQVVGGRELKALGEANYQLMAIGRNLNQIAHAINTDAAKNSRQLTPEVLASIHEKIEAVRHGTHHVIEAASERWEIR